MTLPDITLTQSDGSVGNLQDYRGKTIVVVNTATKCGLNTQFETLEKIYQDYKNEDLIVLGFPSNQFKQEGSTDDEMTETCKVNFGVTFPLHKMAPVNGENTQDVFKWLKNAKGGVFSDAIKWNFTKFLIDKDGNVVERYAPTTDPDDMRPDIDKIIA